MDRFEKLATPFTATTVVVPDSVPPPGLVPMATVTLAVELVTVLSKASRTVTCTAGALDTLLKIAMPPAAATVLVPDSVPPPGLVPMAMVTLAVELVTVLLNASCTVTCTDGEMATPATAFAGWTLKASLAAAAGLMLNAVDTVPVSGDDA